MIAKPEILAPAGDMTKLMAAVQYGADAVYIGGEEFSMRSACDNFSDEELKRAVDHVHAHGKRIYVAANVIMRDEDLEPLAGFARRLAAYGADGVILSDLGAFSVVKEVAPSLPIHVSTQANITNAQSAVMWHKLGASRVVLARELSGSQMQNLRAQTPEDLELEAFVHGAMCVSYSGRCLISNYMTGRDANKGACAQPCRWNYALMEEKRPGEYFPVVENERGTYFFNSKDLCLIGHIPELVQAGVSSFKIEGRVKSEYYVATVVKAYREEVDRYFENPDAYVFDRSQYDELCKVSHRDYSTGFFNGRTEEGIQVYASSSYIRDYEVVGVVVQCDEDGLALVEQRNKFSNGDAVEVLRPGAPHLSLTANLTGLDGNPLEATPHAKMRFYMRMPQQVPEGSFIRKARV